MRVYLGASITIFFTLALAIVSSDVEFVQMKMPENNESFSSQEWRKIMEGMKLKIDKTAKPLLQPVNSGKLSKPISAQIIGGTASIRGQFPWQAYFLIDGSFLCGGSLILTEWILTAGHCAVDGKRFEVTLGSIDRSSKPSDSVSMTTTVKVLHENYSATNLNNDVALLKLPQVVSLNSFINTIKLPPISDGTTTFEGLLATISGFGKTADYSSASRLLNYVQVTVIPNADCAKIYGPSIILSSNICTKQTDKATCQGDSGGPLVYRDSSNIWVQIGVVSFGSSKGCLHGPSGFSRVTSFLSWISDKVGQDLSGETPHPSNSGNDSTTTAPPTTSQVKLSTTKPLKCSSANFASVRRNCCLQSPITDIVPLQRGEKICRASANSLKSFNSYTLNKQQNSKLDHAIDFSDFKVQKSLLKDACFVNCYLQEKGIVKNNSTSLEALTSYFVKNQVDSKWQSIAEQATSDCYNKFYETSNKLEFSDGRTSCDGRLFLVAQCVQQRLTSECPENLITSKCVADQALLGMCSSLITYGTG